MIRDMLKYSVANLWQRKLRSFLSILSILIGITAIFAIVSFGQGINNYIDQFAEEQGKDKLIVMPGGFNAPGTSNIKFDDKDIEFISKIKGVDIATGLISATGKIEFKDFQERYTYIFGFSTENEEMDLVESMLTIDVEKGRKLESGEVYEAMLGYNYLVPDRMFPRSLAVGDKIEINDVEVEVIGFWEEIGNPTDDSQVYLTHDGAKQILDIDDYEYIYLRSSPGVKPSELDDKIRDKFRKFRDQEEGEEEFTVQTFEDVIETFTAVIDILNAILLLIALVSVIVAAVNIMNTMYTSILERTREIGIMKAVGSRNGFILLIFMGEAGILGLIGGIIGIALGYAIASFGGFIAKVYGLSLLQPAFPWWLITSCLLFSFLVGMLSGYLPAKRASEMNPVDALRYE